jgi:hypothetical protein
METNKNPHKFATITYDEQYIHINDKSIHQSLLDHDTEKSYIDMLNGDEESIYDAEKLFIWLAISKYLIDEEFTHVIDRENSDTPIKIDQYLADVRNYTDELYNDLRR